MGAELLTDQLGYNKGTIDMNTAGLEHQDSLASAPGGSNLNWVLGHIVASRNGMLKLLGREPVWDEERAALYGRGSRPVTAATALPFEEIMADFAASQKTVRAALAELTDEEMAVSSKQQFFKGDAETVGSALAAYVFHEAYHAGQTGILRRVAGKKGAIG